MRQFFGKYRGSIVDNADPLGIGRVLVSVPAVYGDDQTSWALPCAPYAGDGVGFFAIPPVGTNVWVEFEEGRSDLPIWAGAFWSSGQTPEPSGSPDVKILKTDNVTITLDDAPGGGGCTIEFTGTGGPATLTMSPDGITLSFGSQKIALSAASVSVNDGALEVM